MTEIRCGTFDVYSNSSGQTVRTFARLSDAEKFVSERKWLAPPTIVFHPVPLPESVRERDGLAEAVNL